MNGDEPRAYDVLEKIEASLPDHIRTRDGQDQTAAKAGTERVHALYWRTIDAFVYGCDSKEDLLDAAAFGPDRVGGYFDPRPAMKSIAEAIVVTHNDSDKRLRDRLSEWKGGNKARVEAMLEEAAQILGIEKPPANIEVLLLPESGGREGMTVRAMSGTRIVLGAGKYTGSDFAEVVLHECLHVLDASSPGGGFYYDLRKAVASSSYEANLKDNIPHATMFALAAALTRKRIDPKHKDVGDRFGAYKRGLAEPHRAVAKAIERLAKAEITRAAAIDQIVHP